MKPILFPENSTSWNTNGEGRLSDAISCIATEQRNGKYELLMIYPTTGKHFDDLAIRKIIAARPSQGAKVQPFRIYKISRPIHGKVTVNAQHISYDLGKYITRPFSVTASASACNTTLQALKSNSFTSCPFTFWTDVTTVASYSQKIPSNIKQRLGGIEGSVVDQYGGEYEWDGYAVKLHKQRGETTNYTLNYGKNIIDVNQEENIANTVTGVVPFWQDAGGESVVYGSVVYNTQYQSRYSTPLLAALDLSDQWDEAPTQAQLTTAAQVYVNETGFGLPKVSIKVSFVNLADTEEYKDILSLQSVKLCDTVKVRFEELGINTTAKIVETNYDVLKEKYESVQIGTLKSTLADVITDYEASMAQTISDTGKRVYAQSSTEAQDLVNNATAWLTSSGGYVIAVKNDDGTWKELLFMDDNDVSEARNVLRINERGIGFSSTGVGGPYTQAWTLDGKLVIGGTNVPSITVYKSDGSIIFQASATAMIWNAENSNMDSSGTLTAKNAILTGGTLNLGGDNNGDIKMFDRNGNLRGEWDKDGLTLYKSDGKTEIFSAGSSGVELTGTLTSQNSDGTKKISLQNAQIRYKNRSGSTIAYIDFDGEASGTAGVHMNANEAVFSVNGLGVTKNRNSNTVYHGKTGNVITGISQDSLSNVCCDLSESGGVFSWTNVTFSYLSGYSTNGTVNGLVVE